jgi:hypothetical protein
MAGQQGGLITMQRQRGLCHNEDGALLKFPPLLFRTGVPFLFVVHPGFQFI